MTSAVPTTVADDPVICDACGKNKAKREYVRTTGNSIRVCSAECFEDAHNAGGPVYFGYHTGPNAAADAMYANRPSGMMTLSSLSDYNRILGLANEWKQPGGSTKERDPEVQFLTQESLAAHHPTTAIKRDRIRNETDRGYRSVEDMMTDWFREVAIQKYMHTFGITPAVFTAGIMMSRIKAQEPRFATWIESTKLDIGLANAFGQMVAVLSDMSSAVHVAAVAGKVAAEITKLLSCVFIMHKNGIIHRDLFARNVMCNKTHTSPGVAVYDWKIIDFGMSSVDFATRKELIPRLLAAATDHVDFVDQAVEDGTTVFDALKWSKITDKGTQFEGRTYFPPTFDAEQLGHPEDYNFTREQLKDNMYPGDYWLAVERLIGEDDYLCTWDNLLKGDGEEILLCPAGCCVIDALYCAVEYDHWKKGHGKHTAARDVDQLAEAIRDLIINDVSKRVSTKELRVLFADVIQAAFITYIKQHPELYPQDAPEWNNALTLVTNMFSRFKQNVMAEGTAMVPKDTTTTTGAGPAPNPAAVAEPVPDMPRSIPRRSPSPLKSSQHRERSRSRQTSKDES